MAEPRREFNRDEVIQAIERWFPPPWFRRFSVEPGWSAQKLLWMAVLMNWVAGQTLTERFAAA